MRCASACISSSTRDGALIVHGHGADSAAPAALLARSTKADLALTFQGDEITRIESAVGELVTVILQNAVDAFVRTFTLVVPEISLLRKGEELEFDAFGIETTDRSGALVPPPGPAGTLQTSRFHQLHGIAQLVDF